MTKYTRIFKFITLVIIILATLTPNNVESYPVIKSPYHVLKWARDKILAYKYKIISKYINGDDDYMKYVKSLHNPEEPKIPIPNYKQHKLPGMFVEDTTKCPPIRDYSNVEPLDIYSVRPKDIKVIAALGDSITASFMSRGRLNNPLKSLFEYRGNSWTIGKDVADTVYSYFQRASKDLIGGSTKYHFPTVCFGPLCPFPHLTRKMYKHLDGYNFAFSGAQFSNMKLQADMLVDEFKKDKNIKESDWKLVTIFIGANDACLGCLGLDSLGIPKTVDDFKETMYEVVEVIRQSVPNVLVNFMTIFKLSGIRELGDKNPVCEKARIFNTYVECTCAFGNSTKQDVSDKLVLLWNEAIHEMHEYYRGRYDDFAFLVDRGMGALNLRELDISFISDVDCFHPSEVGHSYLAKNAWNNLFLPYEEKTSYVSNSSIRIYCPTGEETIPVPY